MRDIVLATNNQGKLDEARKILLPRGYNVLSLKDVGVINFNPEEIGETFLDNAVLKAKLLLQLIPNSCVFADDSGLEVEALEDRPGVRSARYCEGTDTDRCEKILEEMQGKENRKAAFVCSVAFYCKQVSFALSARCEGEIGTEMKGENGFGYDPIFVRNGKCFGEMTQQEKNKCSHRAGAMLQMANYLDDIVKKGLFLGSFERDVRQ
ncbi:MAG: RdgB/HAM1 family non-canonical purine NTP pyrophosphatase [Oscillospiraceae bacterium]|jgi:XTP/dITP diphosphohydrolase|nr:RdgB/HAM1 family non-canonical purine NTP pyrophosphatase [Oscillospiraceae bacterium]